MAFEDTRPRNPDNRRLIDQMFDPENLRRMQGDVSNDFDSEHSIDDHLDNTDDLRAWARKKMKGMRWDPENRKPMQISDSPLSDYNIEFTRLNKTTDSITPSSLSSLNIPQASSDSLSYNMCTPVSGSRKSRDNRRSSAMTRKSGNFTPKMILREKQQARVDRRLTKGERKNFSQMFNPPSNSTPRSERKRNGFSFRPETGSLLSAIDNGNTESIVSSSNGDAHESDDEQSDRTLTNENEAAERVSTSVIPETQPHDTIIPETQDVPETQDYIPETQENDIPVTQDDVANSPVRAQVTQSDIEQQAEPRHNISNISGTRIQSRRPIRGQSKMLTPSNYVPSTTPITKPTPKTPSRLPLPISRTPKPIRTTALAPLTPIVPKEIQRPRVGEVTSSQNAENRIVVLHTPSSSQSNQPAAQPATVIPAPPQNITVNVSVSNTQPQSPQHGTIHQHDQNPESATNGGGSDDDRRQNSTNESLMTNDSDSLDNDANLFASRNDTPKGDNTNTSARRRLFSEDDAAEQTRRSATFNKIDNLTRTIPNDSPHPSSVNVTPSHAHSKKSNTHSFAKSPSVIARISQTFIKPTPQDATYDVSAENHSIPPTMGNRQSNVGVNNDHYLSSITSPHGTYNENGRAFSDHLLELPSEAILESIDVTDDEMNANDEDAIRELSENDEQPSRNSTTLNEKQKSHKNLYSDINPNSPTWNPTVVLSRIRNEPRSASKSTANVSNIRASRSCYLVPPPDEFQDSEIIVERSPGTQQIISQRISSLRKTINENPSLRESIHEPQNKSQNESLPKRGSRGKPRSKKSDPPADLAVLQVNLSKIDEKKSMASSGGPRSRRLRSVNDIHEQDDDDDESVQGIDTSKTNQSNTTVDDPVFKKPDAPAPRKSKTITTTSDQPLSANKSASTMEDSQDQEELIVTVDVQPFDYNDDFDNFEAENPVRNDESGTSNGTVQRDPTPPPSPNRKKTTKPKGRANAPKKPTARSKSKTKQPTATEEVDNEPPNDVTSNETNTRRTKRHRNQSNDMMMRYSLLNLAPSRAEKRKSKAVNVPHTAPVLSNRNDPENEPPRKKQRAQSYTGNKITRPSSTSSNSVRSMKSGAGTSKPTKTTEQHKAANDNHNHHHNRIAVFTQGFDEYIRKKTQEKLQWWKELLDVSEKGPIVHSVDEVDVEYINTKYGQLEITSTDKIGYTEVESVDYGFVPARIRRLGLMRFKPKAAKAEGTNRAELELHILQGKFTIKSGTDELEAYAGSDINIPQGVSYGLVNCADDIGIIQFTYAT